MRTALYIIWLLFPAFFFAMALWARLEQISDKSKKENPGDFMRQGFFVLLCVGVCVFIDRTVLERLAQSIWPEWLPLGFYQVILLPLVLLIGAKAIGPSKEIRIDRAPHPSRRKKP